MKVDSAQMCPVSVKQGWRYMRACDAGRSKVSVVRIQRIYSTENKATSFSSGQRELSVIDGCPY